MAQLPFVSIPGMPGDIERVEAALFLSVRTSDPYLDEIASHLISAGGKLLRPVLTLAAAQVAGGPASDDAVQVAPLGVDRLDPPTRGGHVQHIVEVQRPGLH